MLVFYKCEFFRIEELVDKKTFEKWGERSWMFLRPEALISLDNIRRYFERPVTVNDWLWGGQFHNRGFRPLYSTVGGDYSQHRLGNAFDLDVKGVSAEEARQTIIRLKDDPLFELIMCLETDVGWLHFDCRNIPDRQRILLVAP